MAVQVAEHDNATVWGPVIAVIALVLANLLAWALNERSWVFRHSGGCGLPRMLFVSNRSVG
jgi:hypothetical protein